MFFVLTILAEVGGWVGTSFRVFHWTFTSGKPQNSDLKTLGKFSLAGCSFVLDDYTTIALTFLLTAEGRVKAQRGFPHLGNPGRQEPPTKDSGQEMGY